MNKKDTSIDLFDGQKPYWLKQTELMMNHQVEMII